MGVGSSKINLRTIPYQQQIRIFGSTAWTICNHIPMVKFKDYYAVLGVERKASEKDIKAAYRKLARQYHPDTNQGSKGAEERFKEIAEAYEVLKDPEKRRRYDMLGANWKAGSDFQPPPNFNGFPFDIGNMGGFGKDSPFSDFFDLLFGQTFGPGSPGQPGQGSFGAFRGAQATKGVDQEAEIELSIEELAKGTARNIQVSKPGTKPRTLQVKIPAGVRPGSRVRVPGEAGAAPPGGKAGDLYLKVKLRSHPNFSLEGDNLVSELKISPAQAVLGGEVSVETLDGIVHINVPAMSQSGRLLRLRERGLPKLKDGSRGDHLVRIRLEIPGNMSPEEKTLYEKLLNIEKTRNLGPAGARKS